MAKKTVELVRKDNKKTSLHSEQDAEILLASGKFEKKEVGKEKAK